MSKPGPNLRLIDDGARFILALEGRLDAVGAGRMWQSALHAAESTRSRELAVDLSDVGFCDLGGATLLAVIEETHGGQTEILGASNRVTALLQRARSAILQQPRSPPASHRLNLAAKLGAFQDAGLDRIAFLGETAVALLAVPRRSRMFRPLEVARHADQAGVRSVPLVVLLGFLMGVILAFQSAIPMRRFGADLFVVNLVAISLLRELGPLLAAVILAGRTGSAFAAEIGTMKVNEEVDALATMGLHPMTMLVLPRLAAVMLVIPALTLVLELAGLAGMAMVMHGFGFPLTLVVHQVRTAVTRTDLLGGLFKSVVFGMAIAGIGCRAGLATGIGPRAVGVSATAAVVGGIIATIALDGVFALIFFRLNL